MQISVQSAYPVQLGPIDSLSELLVVAWCGLLPAVRGDFLLPGKTVQVICECCNYSIVSSGSCINPNMLFHSAFYKTNTSAPELVTLTIQLVKILQEADDINSLNETTPLPYTPWLQ